MTIKDAFADMRYLYSLIVNEGKYEWKDEYSCAFRFVYDNSVQHMPDKYYSLFIKLSNEGAD